MEGWPTIRERSASPFPNESGLAQFVLKSVSAPQNFLFYCDPSVTSARIPRLPATLAPKESTTVNVFPSLET